MNEKNDKRSFTTRTIEWQKPRSQCYGWYLAINRFSQDPQLAAWMEPIQASGRSSHAFHLVSLRSSFSPQRTNSNQSWQLANFEIKANKPKCNKSETFLCLFSKDAFPRRRLIVSRIAVCRKWHIIQLKQNKTQPFSCRVPSNFKWS